jgi:hypothetical protein
MFANIEELNLKVIDIVRQKVEHTNQRIYVHDDNAVEMAMMLHCMALCVHVKEEESTF